MSDRFASFVPVVVKRCCSRGFAAAPPATAPAGEESRRERSGYDPPSATTRVDTPLGARNHPFQGAPRIVPVKSGGVPMR